MRGGRSRTSSRFLTLPLTCVRSAVIPSNIAAALNARHATLTGLTIWRFALCSVDSLSDLRLTEFQLSQSRPGDKHCELMLQDEIQLTDGLSQMEIEDRGARRWLRDVRVLRDLLIRSSRTLKRCGTALWPV